HPRLGAEQILEAGGCVGRVDGETGHAAPWLDSIPVTHVRSRFVSSSAVGPSAFNTAASLTSGSIGAAGCAVTGSLGRCDGAWRGVRSPGAGPAGCGAPTGGGAAVAPGAATGGADVWGRGIW